MKLLTIIVSYNFVPWIDRCLGSLRQSQTPTDVMVLDNASADDTVARIRRDYPEVMLVENHRNLGFGHANNIGMLHAIEHGYDAVLLLNQDAWIAPDALGKLAEASSRHPEYGILSPIHLTGSGNRVEQGFATYSGISDLNQQPSAEVVTVPFVDAAIWYIPVSALRRVGLFEPIFYHYGEDKDMANRMGYHGLYTGYLPGVYGCHDREFRQQTRERVMRAERVYHLSEYANIRYTMPRAFALGVLAVGKKALVALLHGRGRDASDYLQMGGRLLMRSREIAQARHFSKHVDLNRYRP